MKNGLLLTAVATHTASNRQSTTLNYFIENQRFFKKVKENYKF